MHDKCICVCTSCDVTVHLLELLPGVVEVLLSVLIVLAVIVLAELSSIGPVSPYVDTRVSSRFSSMSSHVSLDTRVEQHADLYIMYIIYCISTCANNVLYTGMVEQWKPLIVNPLRGVDNVLVTN